ncbi:MAG: DUF3014 domain-containing protein [Burkholderiales bacterium]|nr:DUF3014 domain-containing protein [Burkholderiales bacterium]
MSKAVWWVLVVFGVGVFGLVLYTAMRVPEPQQPPVASTPEPAPAGEAGVKHPVPVENEAAPLPALDESDPAMQEALAGFVPDKTIEELLNLQGFVRRIVATIDNLPGEKLAPRLMPFKRAPGEFTVSGNEAAGYAVTSGNAARYTTYVKLADAIDSGKLVAVYFRYYPLFQQAYRDLGYPEGHFNDRLVDVIDHLLAAPEVPLATTRLERPKVFYVYADPELEARSAGQKILMRMGRENAGRIKAKLREIRAGITAKR